MSRSFVLLLLISSGWANAYQLSLSSSYLTADNVNTTQAGGTYYFSDVSDLSVPIGEQSFVSNASSFYFSAASKENDFALASEEGGSVLIGGQYFIPGIPVAIEYMNTDTKMTVEYKEVIGGYKGEGDSHNMGLYYFPFKNWQLNTNLSTNTSEYKANDLTIRDSVGFRYGIGTRYLMPVGQSHLSMAVSFSRTESEVKDLQVGTGGTTFINRQTRFTNTLYLSSTYYFRRELSLSLSHTASVQDEESSSSTSNALGAYWNPSEAAFISVNYSQSNLSSGENSDQYSLRIGLML